MFRRISRNIGKIKKVSLRLIILLILSSIIPMLFFGIIAIVASIKANNRVVFEGNLSTARRAAEQIDQYISGHISILKALSENISKTDLEPWQIERMLKNYVLEFGSLKEITLFDLNGDAIATTKLNEGDTSTLFDEAKKRALKEGIYLSDLFVEDLIPIMLLALPIKRLGKIDGLMVVRLNLIAMWDLVDGIKIGEEGYAFVVSKDGRLIAHGSGDAKPDVLRGIGMRDIKVVQSALGNKEGSGIYKNNRGVRVTGVSAPIRSLGWGLVIEQPTREAFMEARTLAIKLIILISLVLFLMTAVGYLGGKWQIIRPINELIRNMRMVSDGNLDVLDVEVRISTGDEFQQLGDSFNMMIGRLKELEQEIRGNERSVFFGRIAAGLVHDLRHPVRNIENMSRLLTRMFDDEGYKEDFKRTVERELGIINRFLDDLHNLTHPAPLTMTGIELDRFIDDAIRPFKEEMARSRIGLNKELSINNIRIQADRVALERIFRNIVTNAIDAMHEGGKLTIRTNCEPNKVILEFIDTGVGIDGDRIPLLFTDYQTTKKKGLGLGLAITKRLVEEMGGSISVDSIKGKGTRFIIIFHPLMA